MNKARDYAIDKVNKGLTSNLLRAKTNNRYINYIDLYTPDTYFDNYKEGFQCTKSKAFPEIE